jgi:hypothetical protein
MSLCRLFNWVKIKDIAGKGVLMGSLLVPPCAASAQFFETDATQEELDQWKRDNNTLDAYSNLNSVVNEGQKQVKKMKGNHELEIGTPKEVEAVMGAIFFHANSHDSIALNTSSLAYKRGIEAVRRDTAVNQYLAACFTDLAGINLESASGMAGERQERVVNRRFGWGPDYSRGGYSVMNGDLPPEPEPRKISERQVIYEAPEVIYEKLMEVRLLIAAIEITREIEDARGCFAGKHVQETYWAQALCDQTAFAFNQASREQHPNDPNPPRATEGEKDLGGMINIWKGECACAKATDPYANHVSLDSVRELREKMANTIVKEMAELEDYYQKDLQAHEGYVKYKPAYKDDFEAFAKHWGAVSKMLKINQVKIEDEGLRGL